MTEKSLDHNHVRTLSQPSSDASLKGTLVKTDHLDHFSADNCDELMPFYCDNLSSRLTDNFISSVMASAVADYILEIHNKRYDMNITEKQVG